MAAGHYLNMAPAVEPEEGLEYQNVEMALPDLNFPNEEAAL
jgi:hypothetical protein